MNQIPALNVRAHWRARVTLIALVLLFVVPLVAAVLLNAYAPHWQPFGTINRGDVLAPAVRVESSALRTADGKPLKADFTQGRWTLLYRVCGNCDERCVAA